MSNDMQVLVAGVPLRKAKVAIPKNAIDMMADVGEGQTKIYLRGGKDQIIAMALDDVIATLGAGRLP